MPFGESVGPVVVRSYHIGLDPMCPESIFKPLTHECTCLIKYQNPRDASDWEYSVLENAQSRVGTIIVAADKKREPGEVIYIDQRILVHLV